MAEANSTTAKAADPKAAPKADAPAAPTSKLVASGDDKGDKKVDAKAQADRRDAGIPEPPRPEPGTDLYETAAGYTTVLAGTKPEDKVAPAGPHHPE